MYTHILESSYRVRYLAHWFLYVSFKRTSVLVIPPHILSSSLSFNHLLHGILPVPLLLTLLRLLSFYPLKDLHSPMVLYKFINIANKHTYLQNQRSHPHKREHMKCFCFCVWITWLKTIVYNFIHLLAVLMIVSFSFLLTHLVFCFVSKRGIFLGRLWCPGARFVY